MKSIFLTLFAVFLTSCVTVHETEVLKEEKIYLNLSDPAPLSLKPIKFSVNSGKITMSSAEYSKLSANMKDLQRYIKEQREIIKAYRDFYEKAE